MKKFQKIWNNITFLPWYILFCPKRKITLDRLYRGKYCSERMYNFILKHIVNYPDLKKSELPASTTTALFIKNDK